MEYRRANKLKAATLFFVSRKRYHALAVSHSMALNLEKKDLRAAFEAGTYPSEEQRRHSEENIQRFTKDLHRKLRESCFWVVLASATALVVAYAAGAVSICLEPSIPTVFIFMGSALVGWATLFELGGGIATISGEALHEVVHPVIFKIIFIPGIFSLLIGTLL